jgi:hypothetical protein
MVQTTIPHHTTWASYRALTISPFIYENNGKRRKTTAQKNELKK